MTSFKKTHARNFAKINSFISPDSQYWKNYEFPITVKEFTSIDYIDVCSTEPHYIAVTTGPKVDIYHQQTAQVWRSLTRFQKNAYGGNFRKDGQLLIAGSEECEVKIFNFKHKQLLRVFKGHKGPVHRAHFVNGKPQVVSFSDDKTLSLWDISEEHEISKFGEHKDFVRAGATSPSSEHIVVSGAYDHCIKIWDMRTGSSVVTLNHGSPVESVLFYPSGSVFASAGGTEVKIWDAVAGKCLSVLSQHHKTITSLCLATNNTRLLSGSLDRHIKVYELNSYSTLHSMDYTAPILSVNVAPNDSTLVCGMLSGGSGLISFQQKKISQEKVILMKGKGVNVKKIPLENFCHMPEDQVVTHVEREKLSQYDKLLCKFQFSRVLDIVMQSGTALKSPHITVAVLRELIRRGGLSSALAGRDAKSLNAIFKFLIKHIRNPLFYAVLNEVVNLLLDIYGSTFGENSHLLFHLNRLNEEIELENVETVGGMGVMGAIEMFLTVSSAATNNAHFDEVSAATSNEVLKGKMFNNRSELSSLREKENSELIVDID